MSNDAKFWAYRFLIAAIIVINACLLTIMWQQAMSIDGNVVPPAIAFFILAIISIPLGFKLELAKARRWQDVQRDQQQIAVETLAAIAKQKHTPKKR